MTKSPTYNKKAVDKQLKKDGVNKPKASKLTHKIMKGHQKTDEDVSKRYTPSGLGKKNMEVVKAFINRQPASSQKLHTDGESIDILALGGNGVAYWDGDTIQYRDASGRADQTLIKTIKRMAGSNMNEAVAKIACLECDEVSTEIAWQKNNGSCPKCNNSSRGVAEGAPTTAGAAMNRAQKKYAGAMKRAQNWLNAKHDTGRSIEGAIKKFDLRPADAAKLTDWRTSKSVNESTKYRVTAKSNDDDAVFKSGIKSKADADVTAEKMKKQTRKDGAKMYNSVKVVKESKLTEGVLDDIDDDGFMAKRQLYDLAKYSVELHRMIQDTDNLEPWVQAKITKAADYIDTVKHYLEYQDVRGSEEATVDFGMDDIADVEDTLGTMGGEPEVEIEEDYDDYDDNAINGYNVLGWAKARQIISPEQYEEADVAEDQTLFDIATEVADYIDPGYDIGSSDVSSYMRTFVRSARAAGVRLDGANASRYMTESKAEDIYKKMMSGLRGKK